MDLKDREAYIKEIIEIKGEETPFTTFMNSLYLINSSLTGIKADPGIVMRMSYEKLFQFVKAHGLSVITYNALMNAGARGITAKENEVLNEYKKAIMHLEMRSVLMERETKDVMQFFEDNKIWYMPLKGTILQHMFPKMQMREMADADILIDPKGQEMARDYLAGKGYTVREYGVTNHDEYEKKPVYCFEIHNALVGEGHKSELVDYYKDVKERLVKAKDKEYRYDFTDEDYYIFLVVHAYKHYYSGGTGIRTLLDFFVYLSKMRDKLNWEYIDAELDKLGIKKYEKTATSLCFKMFSFEKLNYGMVFGEVTEDEKGMLQRSINSGVFGNSDNYMEFRIRNKTADETGNITKKSKIKYVLKRIFPDMDFYKQYYPTAYKYKILIPFVVIYRMIKMVFVSPKKYKGEFDTIMSASDSRDNNM